MHGRTTAQGHAYLYDGRQRLVTERDDQVPLHDENNHVTDDGVQVHEDVLHHDVDLGAGDTLDKVLVVHGGEHGTAHLQQEGSLTL